MAADVDASTGDIEYDGNVMIPGTVRTGFTVKAKGDIQVNGVVEGATLIAGGNIVIKRGVQGMSRGRLVSGGDICAHFFESANVEAKGDVLADLNEDLAAEQKARVTYDNILRLIDDPDVCDPIKFLREREIVHYQRFADALRIAQDQLDSKNFYAINPSFDKGINR